MRRESIEYLKCPRCQCEGRFSLGAVRESAIEVLEGSLLCAACGAVFPVLSGYSALLPEPSGAVQEERKAQEALESARQRDRHALGHVFTESDVRAFVLGLPHGLPDAEEHSPVVRYAMDRLAVPENARIVDLGGGTGWAAAWMAARGWQCVVVDISEVYLPLCRHFAESGVFFERVQGDMTRVPLASGRFDAVFANAAVHHCADIGAAAMEIARMLRPGGYGVLVNEPVVGVLQLRRRARFGAAERTHGFSERAYTADEWRRAFRRAHLQTRLEIARAGIAEKAASRRAHPAYAGFLRQRLLDCIEHPGAQRIVTRLLAPVVLRAWPFNVVIWFQKPLSR